MVQRSGVLIGSVGPNHTNHNGSLHLSSAEPFVDEALPFAGPMTAAPLLSPLHVHIDANANGNLAGPFLHPADGSLWAVTPMQFPPAGALVPDVNSNEFVAVPGQNQSQSLGWGKGGEEEKDVTPGRQRHHGYAANNGQPPFYCLCGADFTRPDSLKRHIKAKTKGGASGSKTFRCPLCERYDFEEFSRRDHLTQHLKSYHRLGKKGLDFFA